MFGFFRKNFVNKYIPPHPNHFLKIQWEIHFLNAIFLQQNAPNFFWNSNYIALYQKTAFRFDPGPWEVPEPENT